MTMKATPGDNETVPGAHEEERYEGMSADMRTALKRAASEERDVWLEGLVRESQDGDVPIVLDAREGNSVYLRHADPCDPPDPARIHIRRATGL